MALTRVQSTGRKFASAAPFWIAQLATLPAIGNGLIVVLFGFKSGGLTFPPSACTDNQVGHTYLQATTQSNATGTNAAVVYYLPKVTASNAVFQVSVTIGSVGYYEGAVIEVGGVGAAGLTLDQVAGRTGNAAAVTTGASPAVTGAEVIVAAVHAISANQASITAEVLAPPWTEELENLNYSATIAGEGDTRIRTGAAGTTQTANWTAATSAQYAAVLAAFGGGAPVAIETAQPYVWGPM